MTVNLSRPFKRLTFKEAFKHIANLDWSDLDTLEKATAVMKANGIEMTKTPTWENIIQKLFDELVQPHLVDPTFVLDYLWR